MTMFGPWYEPDNDPSIPPWPGFDPQRIVASIRSALPVAAFVVLCLITLAVMTSVAT